MNEQILKLASSCFPRDGDGNINATPEIIAEFAQLIVRECADILDNKILPPSHPMNSIGFKLKEHFGVRE